MRRMVMETRTKSMIFLDNLTMPSILTGAQVRPEHRVVHRNEILRVLERAAHDSGFIAEIVDRGSIALDDYHLTLPEKAALVSGDIGWVEKHVGKLTDSQCWLLNCMLQREAW
jgi:hypothetical protein